jgi:hypothetical protein
MNPPHDQSDLTKEQDEPSLERRRADAECQSSYEDWISEYARLLSEKNRLEECIRDLRAEIGLPHVIAPRTLITEAGPDDADDLCRQIVIDVCDRNYVMNEIVRSIEILATFMSENAPDRERINRRCWALTHAAMALREALKLKPDTIA